MNAQQQTNFERIRKAIEYIYTHYRQQPALEDIARQMGMSPFHFQRIFTEWAGVSPKKFLQYVSLENAKKMLREGRSSLFDAAMETGLSGTGRLHDLFIRVEGMTPGEYKNGGAGLNVRYSFHPTPLGRILTASTGKGLCFMGFADEEVAALNELKALFPQAKWEEGADVHQQQALHFFEPDRGSQGELKLYLKGTDFQLKVWEALLKIPEGCLVTYGDIAREIGRPQANRAVGTAVGSNPVSLWIPCHRVIRSTGLIGDYHWGSFRKMALIARESSIADNSSLDD